MLLCKCPTALLIQKKHKVSIQKPGIEQRCNVQMTWRTTKWNKRKGNVGHHWVFERSDKHPQLLHVLILLKMSRNQKIRCMIANLLNSLYIAAVEVGFRPRTNVGVAEHGMPSLNCWRRTSRLHVGKLSFISITITLCRIFKRWRTVKHHSSWDHL